MRQQTSNQQSRAFSGYDAPIVHATVLNMTREHEGYRGLTFMQKFTYPSALRTHNLIDFSGATRFSHVMDESQEADGQMNVQDSILKKGQTDNTTCILSVALQAGLSRDVTNSTYSRRFSLQALRLVQASYVCTRSLWQSQTKYWIVSQATSGTRKNRCAATPPLLSGR